MPGIQVCELKRLLFKAKQNNATETVHTSARYISIGNEAGISSGRKVRKNVLYILMSICVLASSSCNSNCTNKVPSRTV